LLQRCEALRFIKVLESGRTKPLMIECECSGQNERQIFIVKAHNLPEVTDFGLYCECLGSLLAIELGINTPRPAIVELTSEFVRVVNLILRPWNLSLRTGLGFGSANLGAGYTSPVAHSYLNAEELIQASQIYAFDVLTQNPDRKPDNPNCAVRNGQFVAFDFNLAFSFLLPIIGQNDEPWEFSKHQIANNHLFVRSLRGKEISWKTFCERFRKLTPERVAEICNLVPFDSGNWSKKICEHFAKLLQNADKLELEFKRSLL
jgi:hypothetical protein